MGFTPVPNSVLRSLLGVSDERDELRQKLSDQFANQYGLAGDLDMALSAEKVVSDERYRCRALLEEAALHIHPEKAETRGLRKRIDTELHGRE